MTPIDCGDFTDLLPAALAGRLEPSLASALAEHLRGCRDCDETAELLRLLGRHSPAPPAGLHQRVLQVLPAQLAAARTLAGLGSSSGGLIDSIEETPARPHTPTAGQRAPDTAVTEPLRVPGVDVPPLLATVGGSRPDLAGQLAPTRARGAPSFWLRPRRPAWRVVGIAATVVLALGGSLWFTAPWRWGATPDEANPWSHARGLLHPFPGWPGDDGYLAGAVVLGNLSEAELEILLTELDW